MLLLAPFRNIFLFLLSLLMFPTLVSFLPNNELEESIKRGRVIYQTLCQSCHQENGQGIPGVYPPLAQSDYLMADKNRSIKIVLEGMMGEITVNGNRYNGVMTPFPLKDREVADVLNFVRNSWSNEGEIVTVEEVAAQR